jgi:hypothetical protein
VNASGTTFPEDNRWRSDSALESFGAGLTPEEAGDDFPGLRSLEQDLETSARYQWTETLATRLMYRLFYGHIRDFTQTGLELRYGQRLFLGHIDRDYLVHLLGASVELRF